jgi:cytochrome c556
MSGACQKAAARKFTTTSGGSMNFKAFVGIGFFAVSAVFASLALAQAKPETLVKQRQAAMTLQGKYYYSIRAMAQGKAPYDAAVVSRNASYLDALTHMPWDGFTANTKDVKTATLPAAFTDTAKFKESGDRLMAETAKLVTLTKGNDEAAIKAQILAIDKICSGCHESFRERQ